MRHRKRSLATRITLTFLGMSLVTVMIVAYLSYNRARAALTEAVYDRLTATLELKEDALNNWIDDKIEDLLFTRNIPELNQRFTRVLEEQSKFQSLAASEIYDVFQSMLINHPDFSEIFFLSRRGGEILISSNLENEGDFRVSDTYFREGMKGVYLQDIYLSPVTFRPTITIAAPVWDEDLRAAGVLAGHLDLVSMDRIIFQSSGLGETGESYLVDSTNTFVAGRGFGRAEYPRGAHSEGIDRALQGLSGTGLYRNYAGVKVVGTYRWIPERNLALIAEISQSEAFYPASRLAVQILILGLVVSLFLTLTTRLLAFRITRPILAVKNAADRISRGDRDMRAPVIATDEVGDLARAFNRMVDEIQESEERFRTIFNTIPDVVNVFRMSDRTIVTVNNRFEVATGYTREEVVGRTTADVGLWRDIGDRERFYEIFNKEGHVHNLECDFVMKDGTIRTVLVSANLITLEGESHLLAITRDISKLKEVENAARESEERFRTIFDTIPDAVAIHRLEDAVYIDVNRGFERLTGYTLDEIGYKTTMDIGLWADTRERERFYEVLNRDGRVRNFETDFVVKNGTIVHGLVSADLITLDGITHLLTITRDVTKLKEAEKAIRESEERFKTIFDTIPDIVAVIRLSDKTIVDVNREFEEVSGYNFEEIASRTTLDAGIVDRIGDRDRFYQIVERDGRVRNFENDYITKDGTVLTLLLSADLITLSGEPHLLTISRDITKLKKAERAARESDEQFRTTFEHASVGMAHVGLDGQWLRVNDRLCEILGYTREELCRMTIQDVTHPDDVEKNVRFGEQLKGKNFDSFTMEKRYIRKDGSVVWVNLSSALLLGDDDSPRYFIGIIQDINDRKIAERALKESEERYRILFNAGSDAIIVFGIDEDNRPGKFYTANEVACRVLGRSYNELLGLTLMDICSPPGENGEMKDLVSTIIEKGQHTFEQVFTDSKGVEIPVEINTNLFDLYETPIIIAVARDLTDRKKAEEERKKIQAKLIQANKMTSLGLMVSSLAHEINNPNNTIIFNLRRFARTWDDALPVLEEYRDEHGDFDLGGVPFTELKNIFPQLMSGTMESSEMIKVIVENLKGFVRQSSDDMDFSVNVNEVVRNSVALLESQVMKGVGRLRLELKEGLPEVRGNPQKLVQVVVNLISNALEALKKEDQGVVVSTSSDTGESAVMIRVSDNGTGMTQRQLNTVFEPFFSTKLESGGTGLGLTITKMLLDEHGASIDISSVPDEGTDVTVTLHAMEDR